MTYFAQKFCSENNIVLEFCLVLCVHRIVRWLSLSDHVGIEGVFLKNTVGEDDESTIPLNWIPAKVTRADLDKFYIYSYS